MNHKVKLARKAVKLVEERFWPDIKVPGDPFETLVRCILSVRSRDEQSIPASRKLLKRYRTPEDLMNASVEEIAEIIRNVGLYNSKARSLKLTSKILVEKYGSRVPADMEKLTRLPGVGRKCANIVLAYGFGIPAIAVDTHVNRVFQRLGVTEKGSTPLETEIVLKKILPEECWIQLNISFVRFGREICKPLNPNCSECPLKEVCEYYRRRNHGLQGGS